MTFDALQRESRLPSGSPGLMEHGPVAGKRCFVGPAGPGLEKSRLVDFKAYFLSLATPLKKASGYIVSFPLSLFIVCVASFSYFALWSFFLALYSICNKDTPEAEVHDTTRLNATLSVGLPITSL